MTIFVSIAAYRDPELIPTLRDCVARAAYPNDLRFGLCRQYGDGDIPPAMDDARLRCIDVPWRDSRGACWARAQCMSLYEGEDYFLQLDSHHRFAQDWDAKLIDQAERAGAPKPLLSTYLPLYDPRVPTPADGAPTMMRFDRFTHEGVALFRLEAITAGAARATPLRARFLSAHMLFTLGAFVQDAPYDPDLYFIGEEITLAVRAFTHGYDLFHPTVHIGWHEYTRNHRPKHWDDHRQGSGVDSPWYDRDAVSLAKVRRFLTEPEVGRFGCGRARTLADYEAYAGVNFRLRTVSAATRRGDEPAPAGDRAGAGARTSLWSATIDLERAALPPAALDRPHLWYVGFHDADGVEIYRQDASRAELAKTLSTSTSHVRLSRRFHSERRPARWTVWPIDLRGRWLEPLSGELEGSSLEQGSLG